MISLKCVQGTLEPKKRVQRPTHQVRHLSWKAHWANKETESMLISYLAGTPWFNTQVSQGGLSSKGSSHPARSWNACPRFSLSWTVISGWGLIKAVPTSYLVRSQSAVALLCVARLLVCLWNWSWARTDTRWTCTSIKGFLAVPWGSCNPIASARSVLVVILPRTFLV